MSDGDAQAVWKQINSLINGSTPGEIIDLGVEYGIIKKSGSWFAYEDSKLGQGRDAAKRCIQDNPELADELEAKIMAAMKEKNEKR